MSTPLTSEPTPKEEDDDAKLQSYITQFVDNREESEKVTLNQAAIKKAERMWKERMERARQEARDAR